MRAFRGFVFSALMAVTALIGLPAAPARAQDQQPPQTATLVIHVQDVSPNGGMVRLGLYDEVSYPNDDADPVAAADVKAEAGETVITLHNIPLGTYAIEAYQDVNGNNKMDTTWLGLPLEPFGFSRDAHPHLAKPRFNAVKFDVVPGQNVQTLHLQNSVSVIARNN